jgi:hypothetical protein
MIVRNSMIVGWPIFNLWLILIVAAA